LNCSNGSTVDFVCAEHSPQGKQSEELPDIQHQVVDHFSLLLVYFVHPSLQTTGHSLKNNHFVYSFWTAALYNESIGCEANPWKSSTYNPHVWWIGEDGGGGKRGGGGDEKIQSL